MRLTSLNGQSKSIFVSVALLAIFPPLVVYGVSQDNYAWVYAILVAFLMVSAVIVQNYLRVLIFFMAFYLSIGLLNISTWRGYTSVQTLSLYAWAMYALLLPILLFARRRSDVNFQWARQQALLKCFILVHLSIVYLAVLIVYATVGNVLSDQTLRFSTSTALQYVIKSALPVAGVLPFLKLRWPILWLVLLILPAVMIGSRGTAVMGLLAYFLVLLFQHGGRVDFRVLFFGDKKFFLLGVGAVAIISVLFFGRRVGDNGLSPIDVIMNRYFDYDNFLIRAILPFYLGFKETIGLATTIITDKVENTLNPLPLFFADLVTVLPGENLAAGQTLSRILGASHSGGLTPGLLGGVYIDYGASSVWIFALTGILLSWMQRAKVTSPFFMIIYVQVITQVIHLFHRGFLKPEYFTAVFIAAFYYVICRGVRLR